MSNSKVNSNKFLGWKWGNKQKLHNLYKRWIIENNLPWNGKEKLVQFDPRVGETVLIPVIGSPDTDEFEIMEIEHEKCTQWLKLTCHGKLGDEQDHILWVTQNKHPTPSGYHVENVWILLLKNYSQGLDSEDRKRTSECMFIARNGGAIFEDVDPFSAWEEMEKVAPLATHCLMSLHAGTFKITGRTTGGNIKTLYLIHTKGTEVLGVSESLLKVIDSTLTLISETTPIAFKDEQGKAHLRIPTRYYLRYGKKKIDLAKYFVRKFTK